MSVINTMLLKLESRGAPEPDAGVGGESVSAALPPPAMRRKTHAASGSGRKLRLAAMVTVGLVLIVAVGWADWPRLMQPLPPPVAEHAQAAHAAPAQDAQPASTGAVAAEGTTAAAPTPAPADEAVPAAAVASIQRPQPPPQVSAPPAAARTSVRDAPVRAVPAGARVATIAPAPDSPATDSPSATAPHAVAPAPAGFQAPVALPPRIDKRVIQPSAAEQAAALQSQAREQAQAGQRRPALELALAALALAPQQSDARLLAALLEHETGHSERAVALLQQGLQARPGDAAMAMLLAQVLVSQGAHPQALAALDGHGVSGAEADGLRGGIHSQLGDFAAAGQFYQRALRERPAHALWWFGLAVALDSQGRAQQARQAYRRATTLGLARTDLSSYASHRLAALD